MYALKDLKPHGDGKVVFHSDDLGGRSSSGEGAGGPAAPGCGAHYHVCGVRPDEQQRRAARRHARARVRRERR